MKEIFSGFCAGVAMLASLMQASLVQARETRVGEAGFESPPATIEQMDWLIGQWTGTGIEGAPAMESWLPPIGGTMVGTFVQESPGGTIMFTEHMYIVAHGNSLALKLKHFNADLTGWEEKGDMLTFRLVAIEECAAYFNALTLKCAGSGNPGSGMVAAVRMKSGEELVFHFDASGSARRAYCADAMTTAEMNDCLAQVLARAEERRAQYLGKAIERHPARPELAEKPRAGDTAFTDYRDAECSAVFEDWIDGTIRGVMGLSCRIEMTDRRTRTIWQNWLTYPDSTPPILPEPKPTL